MLDTTRAHMHVPLQELTASQQHGSDEEERYFAMQRLTAPVQIDPTVQNPGQESTRSIDQIKVGIVKLCKSNYRVGGSVEYDARDVSHSHAATVPTESRSSCFSTDRTCVRRASKPHSKPNGGESSKNPPIPKQRKCTSLPILLVPPHHRIRVSAGTLG